MRAAFTALIVAVFWICVCMALKPPHEPFQAGQGLTIGVVENPPSDADAKTRDEAAAAAKARPDHGGDPCANVKAFLDEKAQDPRYFGSCYKSACVPGLPVVPDDVFDMHADTELHSRGSSSAVHKHVYNADGVVDKQLAALRGDPRKTLLLDTMDERCAFVRERLDRASGPDKHVFFNEGYLLTHPDKARSNVCYIPPHASVVSYDSNLCSPCNHHLYIPRFADIIDPAGIQLAVHYDHDRKAYKPMCEVAFREGLPAQCNPRIAEYADWLYKHVPEREYWYEQTRWMFDEQNQRAETMSNQLRTIIAQDSRIDLLERDKDRLTGARTCLKGNADRVAGDPNEFIKDFVTDARVSNPDADCKLAANATDASTVNNRVKTMVEACYTQQDTGAFLGSLQNVDIEAHRDAWVSHNLSQPPSESRSNVYNEYATDRADLSLTWDRAADKGDARLLALAAGVPGAAWGAAQRLGVERVPFEPGAAPFSHVPDACTYRDEFARGACDVRFRDDCTWKDVVARQSSDAGLGASGEACTWALGGDGLGNFNCREYGSLFADNGMTNHHKRLAAARPRDAAGRLDGMLLRKAGFTAAAGCTYKSTDDAGEGCFSAYSNLCADVAEITHQGASHKLEADTTAVDASVTVDEYDDSKTGAHHVRLRGLGIDAGLRDYVYNPPKTNALRIADDYVAVRQCSADRAAYDATPHVTTLGGDDGELDVDMACVTEAEPQAGLRLVRKGSSAAKGSGVSSKRLPAAQYSCEIEDDSKLVEKAAFDVQAGRGTCAPFTVKQGDACAPATGRADGLVAEVRANAANNGHEVAPRVADPAKAAVLGTLAPGGLYSAQAVSADIRLDDVTAGVYVSGTTGYANVLDGNNNNRVLVDGASYKYAAGKLLNHAPVRCDTAFTKQVGSACVLDPGKIEVHNVKWNETAFARDCKVQCDTLGGRMTLVDGVCSLAANQHFWCDTAAGMTLLNGTCKAPGCDVVRADAPFVKKPSAVAGSLQCGLDAGYAPVLKAQLEAPAPDRSKGGMFGVAKLGLDNALYVETDASQPTSGKYVNNALYIAAAKEQCGVCDDKTMRMLGGRCVPKIASGSGFYQFKAATNALVPVEWSTNAGIAPPDGSYSPTLPQQPVQQTTAPPQLPVEPQTTDPPLPLPSLPLPSLPLPVVTVPQPQPQLPISNPNPITVPTGPVPVLSGFYDGIVNADGFKFEDYPLTFDPANPKVAGNYVLMTNAANMLWMNNPVSMPIQPVSMYQANKDLAPTKIQLSLGSNNVKVAVGFSSTGNALQTIKRMTAPNPTKMDPNKYDPITDWVFGTSSNVSLLPVLRPAATICGVQVFPYMAYTTSEDGMQGGALIHDNNGAGIVNVTAAKLLQFPDTAIWYPVLYTTFLESLSNPSMNTPNPQLESWASANNFCLNFAVNGGEGGRFLGIGNDGAAGIYPNSWLQRTGRLKLEKVTQTTYTVYKNLPRYNVLDVVSGLRLKEGPVVLLPASQMADAYYMANVDAAKKTVISGHDDVGSYYRSILSVVQFGDVNGDIKGSVPKTFEEWVLGATGPYNPAVYPRPWTITQVGCKQSIADQLKSGAFNDWPLAINPQSAPINLYANVITPTSDIYYLAGSTPSDVRDPPGHTGAVSTASVRLTFVLDAAQTAHKVETAGWPANPFNVYDIMTGSGSTGTGSTNIIYQDIMLVPATGDTDTKLKTKSYILYDIKTSRVLVCAGIRDGTTRWEDLGSSFADITTISSEPGYEREWHFAPAAASSAPLPTAPSYALPAFVRLESGMWDLDGDKKPYKYYYYLKPLADDKDGKVAFIKARNPAEALSNNAFFYITDDQGCEFDISSTTTTSNVFMYAPSTQYPYPSTRMRLTGNTGGNAYLRTDEALSYAMTIIPASDATSTANPKTLKFRISNNGPSLGAGGYYYDYKTDIATSTVKWTPTDDPDPPYLIIERLPDAQINLRCASRPNWTAPVATSAPVPSSPVVTSKPAFVPKMPSGAEEGTKGNPFNLYGILFDATPTASSTAVSDFGLCAKALDAHLTSKGFASAYYYVQYDSATVPRVRVFRVYKGYLAGHNQYEKQGINPYKGSPYQIGYGSNVEAALASTFGPLAANYQAEPAATKPSFQQYLRYLCFKEWFNSLESSELRTWGTNPVKRSWLIGTDPNIPMRDRSQHRLSVNIGFDDAPKANALAVLQMTGPASREAATAADLYNVNQLTAKLGNITLTYINVEVAV